jgi:hypothetical protein
MLSLYALFLLLKNLFICLYLYNISMKTYRILFNIILFTGITSILQASPTSKDEALLKAQKFYTGNLCKGLRSGVDLKLVFSDTVINSLNLPITCFYVFNAGNDEGFVIVSGDDLIKPILAYSDRGSFPKTNLPENLKSWLKKYSNEIQFVVAKQSSVENLETNDEITTSLRSAGSYVSPLLGDIMWGQGAPFNIFCPYSSTYSERTVAGCVATAMAQIMKYYQCPATGTGSNNYNFKLDGVSTNLSADFGSTMYKWNNMLNSYTGSSTLAQDTAAALLSYHCGVSVNMEYATSAEGGSAATLSNAGIALKTYFGYDPDLQSYNRDYYDYTTWTDKLKVELNAGRPVLYSGTTNDGGHAFVCDGYSNDGYFHFNWGWEGYANGYFLVDVLNPLNLTTGFVQDQSIITGIQKDDGVSNQSYNLCIYNLGMTSNKSTIDDIGSEYFNVTPGFINFGLNNFSGTVGIGLYKDGTFQKILTQISLVNLQPNYGYNSYPFNKMSLSGLPEGSYKLYLVYQPSGSSSYNQIQGSSTLNNCLIITITGSSAKITIPSAGNNAPTADAGPDQTVNELTTVTLNGSASSDVDGNALTYLWTSPPGITLSSATVTMPTFTTPDVSVDTDFIFTLIVNDGFTNSLPDQVVISVKSVVDNNMIGNHKDIMISPNPAKGILNIKFNTKPRFGTIIKLYEISGKVVLSKTAVNMEESLNLESIPAGSYIIRMEPYNFKTYKVVIE